MVDVAIATAVGSPNDVLTQLPLNLLGRYSTRDLVPTWLETITSSLVKAGCVPVAGITEGADLPAKIIQVNHHIWCSQPKSADGAWGPVKCIGKEGASAVM